MKDIIVLDYIDLSKKEKRCMHRHICRLNRRTRLYHIRKFVKSLLW